MTRKLRSRRAPLADEHLAFAWHSAALLLGYPKNDLLTQLEPLHRASHLLPDEVGGPLRSTVVHLERAPLAQLQQEYVETFDAIHRRNLLVSPRPQSRSLLDTTGSSSHLCVVLERAAGAEPGVGQALLAGCRDGIERLRAALQEAESGWAGAVQAVTATLPVRPPPARPTTLATAQPALPHALPVTGDV
jgi:nitrate reductase delta subunit